MDLYVETSAQLGRMSARVMLALAALNRESPDLGYARELLQKANDDYEAWLGFGIPESE